MNRHTKSVQDLPPSLTHDRSGEPAGGYRHEDGRGDMPKGWKEVAADDQHSPASKEGDERA